ncbi:MAG: hypothetical protein VKK04_04815 [Synechococcales bacterium]|nr:hypothetical protein [Synechococcales bacterium]
MFLSQLIFFVIVSALAIAYGALMGGIIGGLVSSVIAFRAQTRDGFLACIRPSIQQGVIGAVIGSSFIYAYLLFLILSRFESSHDGLVMAAIAVAWIQFTGLGGIFGAIKGAIAGVRRWQKFQNGVKRGEYCSADAKRFFHASDFQPGDSVIWQKKLGRSHTVSIQAFVLQVTPWRVKIATNESPDQTIRIVRYVSPKTLQHHR